MNIHIALCFYVCGRRCLEISYSKQQKGECCTILDLHDPIALQAFLKAATSFDVLQNE